MADDAAPDFDELTRRVATLEAEALDRTRLVNGVERLTEETGGLNAILNKVDDQQQRLTNLGRQLTDVQEKAVSKDDLEANKREQARITMEFRKRTLARVYTTALLLILTLLTLGVVAYAYNQSKLDAQRQICLARTEQTTIIVDVLESSIQGSPPGERRAAIEEAIERFRSLDADCGAL